MRRQTPRHARSGHIAVEYVFMMILILLVVISTVRTISQKTKAMNDNSWKVISGATP